MDIYILTLLVIGLACIGAAWLPHLLQQKPLTFPMIYVGFGVVLFSAVPGIEAPNPLGYGHVTERLTELVVIVALMGAGLKLGRPIGWRRWSSTWRLLGITMLICIAVFAWAGWAILGMAPASAILLGAVLAPTDPVLAAQVQAPPPLEQRNSEVRFALTSEAGLNDGLAFPFTYLAIAVAASGLSPGGWFTNWLLVDLLYSVAAGAAIGVAVGYGIGFLIYRAPKRLAETEEGFVALGLTLFSYAAAELVHGYGFLAVFTTAVTLRHYERIHEFQRTLHQFTEGVERILMAIILILFGGALAGGLLGPLTWPAALVGVAFVLVVRPAAGLLGLAGLQMPLREKAATAFFGIRGVGSLYYLSYALNQERFERAEFLWAVVSFVIVVSILLHGVLTAPAMHTIDQREETSA